MNFKGYLPLTVLLLASLITYAQVPINLASKSPKLQSYPFYRMVETFEDAIYVGGNVAFHNGRAVSPIIKMSATGELDESFNPKIPYTNDFFNDLAGGHAFWNDSIYYLQNGNLLKVSGDSGIEGVELTSDFGYILDIAVHQDSLLVITSPGTLTLVGQDGGTRVIEEELTRSYASVIPIDETSFMILWENDEESIHELMRYKNGERDLQFTTIMVDGNFPPPHVETLASGELLIVSDNIQIEGLTTNGIFIYDDSGFLTDNSFHDADLSFMERIDFATPDGAGGYFLLGQDGNFENVLTKVNAAGVRDDLFESRNYEDYGFLAIRPRLLKLSANRWLLVAEHAEYDGNIANGLTVIDRDGNQAEDFAILHGYAAPSNFQPLSGGQFTIEGRNILNSAAGASGFLTWSLEDGPQAPEFGFELTPENGVGSSLLLSTGEFLISYDDTEDFNQFEVYTGGERLDIPLFLRSNTSSGAGAITNMHETSDGGILLTGDFSYQVDNAFVRTGALKLTSDYEVDASFSFPDVKIYQSTLVDQDRLIVMQREDDNTVKITRLLSDGSEDTSFGSITLDTSFGMSSYFYVNESVLLVWESDSNNPQDVRTYDQDGNLLNSALFSINADKAILDVEQISDTTILIAGNFDQINSIERKALALVNFESGLVYDDLNLKFEGVINQMEVENDTLILLGAASMGGVNTGGFNTIKISGPEAAAITTITNDEAGNIHLDWESDLQARSFQVIRSDADETVTLATLDRGTSTYVDESAAPNVPYSYTVVSANVFGERASAAVDYQLIVPVAPSDLTAERTDTEETVALSWSDNSDNEVGFEIFRSQDAGEALSLAVVDADQTTYTDSDVVTASAYGYTVRALSENFVSESSNEAVVDIILNLATSRDISIYPNPTAGQLHIVMDVPIEGIQVVDFSGKVMLERMGDQKTLDLSDLTSGLYLLRISQRDQVSTYRVLLED
ncbi:MAG: T9SS type A sorting domain-containing protein [Cytophagales bacterium]|nr:T9SS type A sorting domain-containing protein [Cytophagales bacterium]